MNVNSNNINPIFIETCKKNPYKNGVLSGLTFAVKDIIDVSGHITGCGNPSWKATQKKAVTNAFCVDQLLSEGATCIGKTHTDEFAFSLLGENYYYGTPLNPKSPDRVPGGSSSGSVSAVASGLVDFSLGTDTGGSIRIPASNCGVWGYRPSHGKISVAGVHPFAPTFDTVGVFSLTYDVLSKSSHVLIAEEPTEGETTQSFFLLEDAFTISDDIVQTSLLRDLKDMINYDIISFSDIFTDGIDINFKKIFNIYCQIQWAEIWNTHGSIIHYKQLDLGENTQKNFDITSKVDRSLLQESVNFRQRFSNHINKYLHNKILIIPTSPTLAPKKGSIGKDRRKGDYYPRTLGLTAIAGLGKLPQLSIPFSEYNNIPIGLSLISPYSTDRVLFNMAKIFNS